MIRPATLTPWTRPTPDEIREVLQSQGWSQGDAARACDVNRRTVRKWASGESPISYNSWRTLIEAAGIAKQESTMQYLTTTASEWLAGQYFAAQNDVAPAGYQYNPARVIAWVESSNVRRELCEAAAAGNEAAAENLTGQMDEAAPIWSPVDAG